MTNPIGGLTANNAAFNWMNRVDAVRGLCSFRGNNPSLLLNSEKQLTSDMLNDRLGYKAGMLQQDGLKKLSDENIKRTFSTFA